MHASKKSTLTHRTRYLKKKLRFQTFVKAPVEKTTTSAAPVAKEDESSAANGHHSNCVSLLVLAIGLRKIQRFGL